MSRSRSARALTPRIAPDIWPVAIVVVLAMIMAALDTTIVNIALISLSGDLHTSLDNVQWVVTAYLLSLAAVVPVSGWLARRYGAKRVFVWSIVLFTFGSALCGVASSVGMLIGFRVLQGVGGGILASVGLMIVVEKAGSAALARVMGAISVPIIMAPIVGPTIGGLILDNASWRWIFYVNVPVGMITLFAALRKLPDVKPEPVAALDFRGLVLIGSGLVGITYGLAGAGTDGFTATKVWLPLAGGVVLTATFVWHALRVRHPLLDMRLYKNKAFSAASLTTFALGGSMYGALILMPLYFQVVRGEGPVATGLLLGPQGIGSAFAVWLGGRCIDRYGAGATAVAGSIVGVVSTIPFLFLGADTSFVFLSMVSVLRGFGVGLSAMPAMTAAYRVLEPEQVIDATPQLSVLQRLGGSIGTAILTVIVQNRLNSAGTSVAAQAAAFDTAFWWVLAIIVLAALPTVLLMRLERQAMRLDRITADLPIDSLAGVA